MFEKSDDWSIWLLKKIIWWLKNVKKMIWWFSNLMIVKSDGWKIWWLKIWWLKLGMTEESDDRSIWWPNTGWLKPNLQTYHSKPVSTACSKIMCWKYTSVSRATRSASHAANRRQWCPAPPARLPSWGGTMAWRLSSESSLEKTRGIKLRKF